MIIEAILNTRSVASEERRLTKKYEPMAEKAYASLVRVGITAFKKAPEDDPEEGEKLAVAAMRRAGRGSFMALYNHFYTEAIPVFAEMQFQALGGYAERARKPWERAAARFIRRFAGQAIAGITQSTMRWFRRIVTIGTDSGEGTERLARRLTRASKQFSRQRSILWVKTELVAASNYGSITGARETGLDLVKFWITSIDGRERPAHHDAHDQEQPLDKPFIVDGEKLDYAGDPAASLKNRIRCRCTVGYKPA